MNKIIVSFPGVGKGNPVFLPRESHGQRSLGDYSPWDDKELDMTEQLSIACLDSRSILFQVWSRVPVWVPKTLSWVHEANTIFIGILRPCLPFPPLLS